MRTRVSILFAICVAATRVFGGETIAPFAKQWLKVDLDAIQLGKAVAETNDFHRIAPPGDGFNPAFLPQDPEIIWMANAVCAKFSEDYPNRVLALGFRKGRMVTMRVSVSAAQAMLHAQINPEKPEPNELKKAREELLRLQSELVKAGPGHKMNYDDGRFKINYVANCSPAPDSIGYCIYQISVIEKGVEK